MQSILCWKQDHEQSLFFTDNEARTSDLRLSFSHVTPSQISVRKMKIKFKIGEFLQPS